MVSPECFYFCIAVICLLDFHDLRQWLRQGWATVIFARRAVQSRVDYLRGVFDQKSIKAMVDRLNRPGIDSLAAMWEVVVLAGLAKCGNLQHEIPLPSGRNPDVRLETARISFTADITCVSDRGLDEQNPFWDLMNLVSAAKDKMGFPSGGLDLRALPMEIRNKRGHRRALRLPPKNKIPEFFRNRILPRMRELKKGDVEPLRINIDDHEAGLELTIDPAGSEFTTGNYAAYAAPTVKDNNPFYKALRAKADQLRGAGGLSGVIVVDGGCQAISNDRMGFDTVSREEIAERFLDQHSSVDFVLIIAVHDVLAASLPARTEVAVMPSLVTRRGIEWRQDLSEILKRLLADLPKPVCSAANGARRAQSAEYDLGHHGGFNVRGNKVRVSARELVEILAGVRRREDGSPDEEIKGNWPPRDMSDVFKNMLGQGRLPSQITVVPSEEDEEDDWIEFDFDKIDPAIAPFR